MKKIQLNAAKLQLKKEKVNSLSGSQMATLQGGGENATGNGDQGGDPPAFTYSLSWGARCIVSKQNGAQSPFDCGLQETRDTRSPY